MSDDARSHPSRSLRLVVAYDGTDLVGWQRQAHGTSVQGLLEAALARIEGRPVTVTGAGRTDAGVHALGQVASLRLAHAIGVADLQRALNAMLPPEVRVLSVEQVDDAFHARYSAREKTYRYLIGNGPIESPFLHRYAWHLPQALSAAAMAAGAERLLGRHDFSAFQSAGSVVASGIRTVSACRLVEATGVAWSWPPASSTGPGAPGDRLLLVEITADGFLRHMVRAIVGTLVEVGCGRRDPAWVASLLETRARDAAGPTAPARGLWLVGVRY